MAEELKEWYNGIPPITRVWFTLLVVFPLAGRFEIFDPFSLYLDWHELFSNGQIWRIVTATFYCEMGFPYLIMLYFIYKYSRMLEAGVFDGRPADYITMLAFAWIICFIFMNMSMFVVVYVWCMINKDETVSFWFGTRFKASLFPWVLFAFNLIIDRSALLLSSLILKLSYISELSGIAAGHLYFFLKFKYPVDFGGASFVETPRFLYQFFPSSRMTAGFGRSGQPLRRAADGGAADDDVQYRGRHQWGQGRRLAD